MINIKIMAVIGSTGSGKTALSFKYLDNLKAEGKEIYILNHPRPSQVTDRGFKIMYSIEEIQDKQNIVLFIDEPQLHLPVYEKRNNDLLMRLFSIARHREIILILATSNTRYINKGIESYIDTWIIKDIDYMSVKNGSVIKHIIKNYSLIDPRGFKLNINQYILFNRQQPSLNGLKTFNKPSYYSDSYSKPYALENSENSENSEKKVL